MADVLTNQRLAGVVAFYSGPDSIVSAMHKVREANYASFDAFSPYPIHGMDYAQGLKRSWIPWVTFAMGLTGTVLAFVYQYWTSVIDWPLIVGGKPFNSWPAFIPTVFEITVLLAGVATFLSVIGGCHLPNFRKKAFDPGITRDRFAILIEAADGGRDYKSFDQMEVENFLKKTGATEVRGIYDEGWF